MSKMIVVIAMAVFVLGSFSFSCSKPAPVAVPPVSVPSASNQAVPPASSPAVVPAASAQPNPVKGVNRVDVIYFHTPQRCASCICFQEHVTTVINTFFKDELASGKLTFQVINTSDKSKADIVKKYQAMGTQLFINTIRGGVDEIRDIQDIWSWKCLNDAKGFEAKAKSLIGVKLQDASSG